MPQAVFTFLNHYSFDGKIILPICTHEGSGMGQSELYIVRTCKNAKVLKGIKIQGSYANACDEILKNELKGF